jgi:hypothetical protein
MTTIEDRLRAATRAAAETVEPGSAPPLRLPDPQRHRDHPGRPGRARWAGWAAPLVAAAAVTAVIAGALTASRLVFQAPAPRTSPADRGSLVTVPLRRAPTAVNGAIPPYVVGLAPGTLAAQSTRAVVRATASGAVLATLSPPRGYGSFTWVTGAVDDRTFVLAAYGRGPVTGSAPARARNATAFFLLRLDPAAGTARLSSLPVPAQPDLPGMGSAISGIALSPDGGQLAVALGNQSGPSELKLFDLRARSARTWRGRPGSQIDGYISADELGANPLSWAADSKTLAVDQEVGQAVKVRLLDTTAPGGDLWASARAATFPNWPGGSVAGTAIITPDGTRIIAMAVTHHATCIQLNEFSASSGKPLGVAVRLRYRRGAITGWPNVLWSDSPGSTLIVKTTRLGTGPSQRGDLTPEVIGVVTRGQFTPLPGIPADNMLAW